jgi:transcriptional regulator
MYIPKLYREEDRQKILEFINQNNFAVLVTYDGEKPIASHLPLEISEDKHDGLILYGHMSRANPQWKTFSESEALVIFQGAHTYISPRWYNHVNVPTWNYMNVHVYGKPRLVEGDELYAMMSRLVQRHEAQSNYRLENLPQDFVQKEVKGIVGLALAVTRLEASYKLSQNRNDEDYRNIIIELEKRTDASSHAVADAMKRYRP